ncbi:MAG: hypothetical protein K5893_12090 [Prevotella sp.]|nr:hypothetical protein [Prevotella sp.]
MTKEEYTRLMSYLPFYGAGKNNLRLAVIGARGSGKSYLLFDMIHAFGQLGFVPEPVKPGYPHSSFGAFFYDALNGDTGGMKQTERYACRPRNHYGATFRINALRRLHVDFLNIPGEVFDGGKKKLGMFFELKKCIEHVEKGVFTVSEWRSPVGGREMIVTGASHKPAYPTTPPSPMQGNEDQRGNYLDWKEIYNNLVSNGFIELKRKEVSGKALLKHITELNTDSLLLTIRNEWNRITSWLSLDLQEYEAWGVLHDFYSLMVCQTATDIIICDRLSAPTGVGELLETVAQQVGSVEGRTPSVYLAFREADKLLKAPLEGPAETLYKRAEAEIRQGLRKGGEMQSSLVNMTDAVRRHIMQSIGDGVGHAFWHLLNAAEPRNYWWRLKQRLFNWPPIFEQASQGGLPPYMYFTATPIDKSLRLYHSDPSDVTRFYNSDDGQLRSFTKELACSRTEHLCFGSLQLLKDILGRYGLSNGINGKKE